MRLIIFFLCMSMIPSLLGQSQKSWSYPKTHKAEVSDDYFGTKVQDPFRWLEDDNSAETAKWVQEQNQVTFDYLASIPFREKIRERLTVLWNYPRVSAPFRKDGMVFYYKNDGLQNQSVLYVKDSLNAKDDRILLDPNTLSADGTVALGQVSVSKDGRFLAYSISRGGSDWNEVFVREIKTGIDLPDHLKWVKFSGMTWTGNGFFYSRYDAPKEGAALSGKNEFHKVYYHKLGSAQEDDQLIYENPAFPLRNYSVYATENEQFLFLNETESTHGNALYCMDNRKPGQAWVKLAEGFEHEYSVVDHSGENFLILTNYLAPKYRLVSVNLQKPGVEHWKEIIPERKEVLEWVTPSGGRLVAGYMKNACSEVEMFSMDGKTLGKVELPGIGTVGGFNTRREDELAFFVFTSFTTPGEVYQINTKTLKSTLFIRPKVDFDGQKYETKQVFYPSADGTLIPMFITHKKGLVLNGTNPTLLYGYGGFNVSLNPGFSVTRVIWLENGGIVAVANLRGGGEFGEDWHKAGTKLQKQNVFDDFISAAEYLIREKYTSPRRLTIQGGSNGGLLVGAVLNQRPELFAVGLPAVGVMDMLRFHKFTIGWAWTGDYGSSENKEEFDYLLKYSPIHNIHPGVPYPAVLVTTADHDDRVVPAHSFKYIATLQENYQGKNPVMIRVDVKAGHGAGKPTAMTISEYADLWSFAFWNMGFTPVYP